METWIASLVVLTAGILIGYYFRDARDIANKAIASVHNNVRHEDQRPQSTILEPPLTPSEKALREQEELLESINPS